MSSDFFFFFFYFTFYSCIDPVGFLPWEIRVAFPGESQLRQSRATQRKVHAGCSSSEMDYRIFNLRTDVYAYIAQRGVRTP